jgi:MoaA/NifB/PqqE/SkfB family radical SAM enzyme
MEAFFDRHKFGLTLSFDGTAQEEGREKGSLDLTVQAMKRIKQYPGIDLEINSVFTPRTVSTLTESVRFINEHNGPDIFINMDTTAEWTPQDLDTLRDELKRLGDFLLCHYKEKGVIPVKSYQATDTLVEADTMNERKRGLFRCSAGQDRMAVTPDGELWGCFLFHDYYKGKENNPEYRDYSFGTLTGFITGHKTGYPGIVKNYSELRQDLFQVKKEKGGENDFCFLCEYMEGCVACPVNAAYSSGTMGVISCRNCELKKIQRDAQTHFRKELRSLDSQPE